MKPLEHLAAEIATAHGMGLAPARWHQWAQEAVALLRDEWLSEQAFRLRTGASQKWCRGHFPACAKQGIARRGMKGREWHVSARPPRSRDLAAMEDEMVASYEKAS